MSKQPWQLTGAGPESYERYQVPSVFGPLAKIFLDRMALRPGQRVLDVACGTGVVARAAASILGASGEVVGTDLSAEMLEVARARSSAGGARIHWQQGDAMALPCADAEFDVVLCQQGLQFFPDKVGALREMHRVLKPRGSLGVCVWRSIEHSPLLSAISDALKLHASEDIAGGFGVPFAFGDRLALEAAISDAGFQEIECRVDEVVRTLLRAEESIPGLLASTPIGPRVASLSEEFRDAIVEHVAGTLSEYRHGDGFKVPQSTHIATATKS
jgi:ubiquinone/menaquinone biosynthesis C-methylase UbiE